MTVKELIALLQTAPADIPVFMYSDAEGNSEHNLDTVTFHGPTVHVTHATAIVLVPGHDWGTNE